MSNESPAPQAILVLGMHRSGTSMVAGALRLCGIELGRDLLDPAADNPKGFWEHAGIVALHDRLLAQFDLEWNDPRPLPAGWETSPAALQAGIELEILLRKDFSGASLWAVKDPRMCRLLPLWWPVLERMGVRPTALFVLRDPRQVARSLETRNDWPESLSRLLWIEHLLEAEHATAGIAREVIEFGDFLDAPVAALKHAFRTLGIAATVADASSEQVEAFVSRDDRHPVPDFAEAAAWDLPNAMFAAMRCTNPWGELQPLAQRFRQAQGLFAEALNDCLQLPEYERNLRRSLQRQLHDASAESVRRGEWARDLDLRLAEAQAWGVSLEVELGATREQLETWVRSLKSELAASNEQIKAVQASHAEAVAWGRAADQQIQDERQQSQAEIDCLKEQLRYVGSAWTWRLTRPLRGLSRLLRGISPRG